MLDPAAPIEIFEEIDSTVVEARRRAEFNDFGPVWLLARRQTAGRGRRGRTWASPEGNLFATYLGQTEWPPAKIALLGFAAGLAIAAAIEAAGVKAAALKWPNDVFAGDAKLAGILLDSGAIGGGGHWFALAFGVNIANAPGGLDQKTTAIVEHVGGAPPAAEALLKDIRPRLEGWAARLERDGFTPLREAWLARAFGLGRPLRAVLGAETIEGAMRGLSVHGELEIETAAGMRYISAGDIHFPGA